MNAASMADEISRIMKIVLALENTPKAPDRLIWAIFSRRARGFSGFSRERLGTTGADGVIDESDAERTEGESDWWDWWAWVGRTEQTGFEQKVSKVTKGESPG
jgi:hypothetical protein